MKQIAVKLLATAVMAMGVASAAQANTSMLSGSSLLGGTTSVTFQTLSGVRSASFFVSTPGVMLSSLTLTPDGDAAFAVSPLLLLGSGTLSIRNLVANTYYTLAFTAPAAGASFEVTTSMGDTSYSVLNPSSQVPEAGSVVMALAGLGVLGLLGRRRLG
jgi:PEP-CTERM motif